MIFRDFPIENRVGNGRSSRRVAGHVLRLILHSFSMFFRAARAKSLLSEQAFSIGIYSTLRMFAFFVEAAFHINLVRSWCANRMPFFNEKTSKKRAKSVPIGRRWSKIVFFDPGVDFGRI